MFSQKYRSLIVGIYLIDTPTSVANDSDLTKSILNQITASSILVCLRNPEWREIRQEMVLAFLMQLKRVNCSIRIPQTSLFLMPSGNFNLKYLQGNELGIKPTTPNKEHVYNKTMIVPTHFRYQRSQSLLLLKRS